MNTTKIGKWAIQLLACTIILMGMNTNMQAQDDSENEPMLLSISEFTIKTGHNLAFQEGVKTWKSCYLENDGKWTWNMWYRMNGEGTVYYLTSYSASWTDFAAEDPAGQACYRQAAELIMPAVEKVEDHFSWTKPEWSLTPGDSQNTVVEVAYFRVKDRMIFNSLVTDVMEIIEESQGSKRSMWYESQGGGPDGFHYMNVFPYENMEALDEPVESAWSIIAEAEGEDTRDEYYEDYKNSVENSWMYIFRLNEEMSHSEGDE
ncbi:hypothetical protein [Rhodohalobacter sulfatireducens]|uniref:Uncharacterized protein n=1 Tax=Rhodohalobacter sulfatireducens TaxID=2911366 RepID=A0ABS9KJE7_9BACT|nr:hypothetical protein [Rhodohalobacter sulfatireducens]MCG2590954.1 hypothetical protein [Rhodohalobacter sulfatireducens]